MMILSINIGEELLQTAEIMFTGKKLRLVSFHEEKISNGALPIDYADGLKKKSAGRKVCVSVPSDEAVIRTVKLPFGNDEKISRVVRFEAEKYLPFPAEESVLGYAVIERGKDYSEVLIAAMRAETLNRHLAVLENAGIIPDIVAPDLICLCALIKEDEKTVILVDGNRKTSRLCAVKGSLPVFVQTLSSGWDDTDGLASGLGLFRGVFCLREPQEAPAEIIVTGESLTESVRDEISEKLEMSVRTLNPLDEAEHSLENAEQYRGKIDIVLGLARLGVSRKPVLNLKEKPLRNSYKSSPMLAAVLVFLTVVFLAGAAAVKYGRKQQRLMYLEGRIKETIDYVIDDESLARRPDMEIISILRSRITEAEKEWAALHETGSESVLEVLREINLRIGRDVPVSVTNIRIDRGASHIDGRAGSFREVEEIFNRLAGSEYFYSARISRAQVDSALGGVVFRIEVSYPEGFAKPHDGRGSP